MKDQNKTKKQQAKGKGRYLQDHGGSACDEKNEINSVEGIAMDVTEYIKNEEILNENEDRYQTLLKSIQDGVYTLDSKGRFTYVNDVIIKRSGYSGDWFLGKSYLDVIRPEDRERVRNYFESVMQGEAVPVYELAYPISSGTTMYVEVNTTPIRKGSRITGLFGISRDITQHKQAEEQLRESEEKYRILVENSLQGIVIAQQNPIRLVFVNPSMKKMLGYTSNELTSFSPEKLQGLIHPLDRVDFFEKFRDRLEGKSVPSFYEVRGIRKDEKEVWFEINTSRIEYKGQAAVQAVFIDITERKRMEAQIKASLKEKEVLLREIYHRVKNNLQIISSLILLQSGYFKDPQDLKRLREVFNRIKAIAIIHEKLYQSKDFVHVDFKTYLNDLVNFLLISHGIHMGQIDLTVDSEDIRLTPEWGIPCGLLIHELVSNSLSHAFSKKDQAKKQISITLRRRNKRTLELTVGDNGTGLPRGVDFRETETLGFQLVNTLVQQLQGVIRLQRGKGTTFKIVFKPRINQNGSWAENSDR